MRVVIECKRDAFGEVILNQLYRLTSLKLVRHQHAGDRRRVFSGTLN